MRSPICAAALAAATLTLAGCVTGGMDAETKLALDQTLASVQELTELWQERLDALDEGNNGDGDTGTETPSETDVSLTLIGSALKTGTETSDLYDPDRLWQPIGAFPGERDMYSYAAWGVSGMDSGTPLFTATISGERNADGPNTAFFDPYSTSVIGLRQFDNPTGSGTAGWTGKVRAYETRPHVTFGTPVEGDAEVTMDLDHYLDEVDVTFTNFDRGHPNMSWTGVSVRGGRFSNAGGLSSGNLEGSFYGDNHEGVAGTFDHRKLKGIFGAVRE